MLGMFSKKIVSENSSLIIFHRLFYKRVCIKQNLAIWFYDFKSFLKAVLACNAPFLFFKNTP